MKKLITRLHLYTKVPILFLFLLDTYLKSSIKLFDFTIFSLIIIVMIFPYLEVIKFPLPLYNLTGAKWIMTASIGIALYYFLMNVSMNAVVRNLIMFTFSLYYLILDKDSSIESFTSKKLKFKYVKEWSFVFARVISRYICRIFLVISLFASVSLIFNYEPLTSMLKSLLVPFISIQIFFLYIVMMQLFSGLKEFAIENILFALIILGMLDPNWWEGISILFSLIGIAFSNDFIKKYTKNSLRIIDASFFKLIIPYVAFLMYLVLTITHTLVSNEKKIEILNSIMVNLTYTTNDILSLSLLNGASELLLFVLFWLLFKYLFKWLNVFNDQFFYQYDSLGKTVWSQTSTMIVDEKEE